jgi:hypothetical protein
MLDRGMVWSVVLMVGLLVLADFDDLETAASRDSSINLLLNFTRAGGFLCWLINFLALNLANALSETSVFSCL